MAACSCRIFAFPCQHCQLVDLCITASIVLLTGFAALAVVVAAGALAYVVAQRLSNFSGSRAAQGSPSGPAQHAQAAQTTQHAVSEAHEGDDDADSADKMSWELTDAERSAWHAQQVRCRSVEQLCSTGCA